MEFYIFSVIVIWLTVLTLSLLLLWSRPIPRDESVFMGEIEPNDPMLEVENSRLSDENLRLFEENMRFRKALKEIASYEGRGVNKDADWYLFVVLDTAKQALNDRR